jgi:hypothetical protein
LEVTIELVDDVFSGGHLESMSTEYSLKASDKGPLPGALLADQYQRDLSLRGWVLD